MIDARFFRIAAVSSMLSAVTTLLLIFLPEFYSGAEGFEARMARVYEPAYRLRAWVYLVHPFLTACAALGIALSIRRRAPVLALLGMLGFLWWALTEASQQTLTLFAFDRWRVAWNAADETARATIRINAAMYDGIWDGMYVLILIAFAVGNACFGAALIRGDGLERAVAGFLFAATALTLVLLVREIGAPLVPESVLKWSYPAIQPLGRTLIGVWLWRSATAIPARK